MIDRWIDRMNKLMNRSFVFFHHTSHQVEAANSSHTFFFFFLEPQSECCRCLWRFQDSLTINAAINGRRSRPWAQAQRPLRSVFMVFYINAAAAFTLLPPPFAFPGVCTQTRWIQSEACSLSFVRSHLSMHSLLQMTNEPNNCAFLAF